MKILLIDNGTTLIHKLEKLIPGHEIVKGFDQLNTNTKDFDLIILSGGSKYQLVSNEEKFSKEITLVKNSNIPIIGICFGYEIIATAFGATLRELSTDKKGIYEIELLDKTLGKGKISVYESHKWVIKTLPETFEVLAKSADGPEIIKHRDFPIYGLQFHPENLAEETQGDEIFMKILSKIFS